MHAHDLKLCGKINKQSGQDAHLTGVTTFLWGGHPARLCFHRYPKIHFLTKLNLYLLRKILNYISEFVEKDIQQAQCLSIPEHYADLRKSNCEI